MAAFAWTLHTRGVRLGRLLLVVVAVLAVMVAAASAAPEERLVVSGSFRATSERSVDGTYWGCGIQPGGTLTFWGNAMRIVGRGPQVARVYFRVQHYRGLGRYSATAPAPYHRTAVQVTTAKNGASGVGTGFYVANKGSLRIVRAKNVGRRGHWASLSGTVQARLRLQRGSKHLRLAGTWQCQIEPVENGVR